MKPKDLRDELRISWEWKNDECLYTVALSVASRPVILDKENLQRIIENLQYVIDESEGVI